MVRNKTLVLVCAVLAVGLFVLPSALSLFAGQHQFVTGTSVECSKCHGAEYGEIAASQSDAHKNKPCKDCHQTSAAFDSTVQHASISPQCIVCHSSSSSTKNTGGGDIATELLNDTESHRKFYQGALNSSLEQGGNEACIGCHTHIGVNITWERAKTLNFTAGHDADGWVLGNFTAEGTNTTWTSDGGY